MKKIFVLFVVILLCGCVTKTPDASFYTLAPADNIVNISARRITVDIERVKIPEYIDRAPIVTTRGVNVDISQQNRWAEGLSAMIGRKMIANIGTALPNASVKDGNFMAMSGDYTVFIEIYKLSGEIGATAECDAIYSVMDASGNTVATRHVKYTSPAGANYAEYVAALSQMLDKLSLTVAHALGGQK